MSPSLSERIKDRLPGLNPRLVDEHVRRLDERYFQRFSEDEIAAHLEGLAVLGGGHPVQVIAAAATGGLPVYTVLAFDHQGAFSLISGVLSALGFDIRSGDIFTWGSPDSRTPRDLFLRRRRIIDEFAGVTAPGAGRDEAWREKLCETLGEIFRALEQGGDAAVHARQIVNEMAARKLADLRLETGGLLYPVRIEMDPSASRTRMHVKTQDTPFFLYTFSTALSLQDVSIEHVTIRTEEGRIEDEFEFVDGAGDPITDSVRLDTIKLSVLLTKQFTSFLGSASDPLAALLRFEQLVKEIVAAPGHARWVELLSHQKVLQDLAQLLGASSFLWEDFVRLQYEELIPLLGPGVPGKSLVEPIELLPERLELALAGATGPEEFARELNEFKDREIYLYDLDHILAPQRRASATEESFISDFLTLSRRLTALAEVVVDVAASFAWRQLAARFGEPRTVAGLPVKLAIMGLGKLGGVALGYASDIELLFVYSDNGSTEGPEVIGNAEFFDSVVRFVLHMVHAKREGIFHIDLRLRPFGAAGPLACSLESFCTYYVPGAGSHSLERLSLVRLRTIGGDRELGRRVERLRDEMIYAARSVDLAELRDIRLKQAQDKIQHGRLNAKFSPGGLVDLEYAVQILQVTHGAAEPRLRTPRIHEALDALASVGVVDAAEAQELVSAYRFFRHLINGLRMLRGSAQDLFLPGLHDDEYNHLARRMGYSPDAELGPARKLHLDFEAHSAEVRAFVEKYFGRETLPGTPRVTVADIVLSNAVPEELALAALADKGFANPARAILNIRQIAGEADRRPLFARLATLATDVLAQKPDPDMALNNWERLLHALPDPAAHLRQMLSQPMRLEILLSIFSASQFLADTLVREPELVEYIGRGDVLNAPRAAAEICKELADISAANADQGAWADALRRYRRREILRIGARDICLGTPTQRIMEELSDLADAVIESALNRARQELEARAGGRTAPAFCVIAFGKLGGRELNYSSDIDLLGLCGSHETDVERATPLMEAVRAHLSSHTSEGYAYRVDLRLRPYGSSGQLVFSLASLRDYYGRNAALWEVQALLKARPVAGDVALGEEFLRMAREVLLSVHAPAEIAASISRLRREALRALSRNILTTTDIKTGLGGLRDVEFLAQGLQLVHAREKPELLQGGTLPALRALAAAGALRQETAEQLSSDYLFLRRVEHFLQIYEDRQTHSLPSDPGQLRALARLMLGTGATAEQLVAKLSRRRERVHAEYLRFVADDDAEPADPT
jgi:glutamate-ammonia-ligase adenylyltransferase